MNKIKFSIPLFGMISLMICVAGCNRVKPVNVKVERLEQSLFTLPLDSVAEAVPQLQAQYGELLELFSRYIINIGPTDDPEYPQKLMAFITDANMYGAYKRCASCYPDVHWLEHDLGFAFARYHRDFPDRKLPKVYTLMSGFNQSLTVDEGVLAISLERYLGADDKFYERLSLPRYQRRLMNRENIVPDCIKALVMTDFPISDSANNVLSNILYEGKVAWVTRRELPDVPDSLIFGYTAPQLKWCRNNTKQMWTYLVEHKLLYSTDQLSISKLVGPAPFTSLFTSESPGRAVVWLGFQIVESYMKHNDDSPEQLMRRHDAAELLAKAKFRP